MWLATTRAVKAQRGSVILRRSAGDLKLMIDELSLEELQEEGSGQMVLKRIQKSFSEFLVRELPKAFEALFYHPDAKRTNDESTVNYIGRKRVLFRELDSTSYYRQN